jgi:hypothetical protein
MRGIVGAWGRGAYRSIEDPFSFGIVANRTTLKGGRARLRSEPGGARRPRATGRPRSHCRWHEVPGTTPPQKSRPVGYGLIRAGVRANLSRGVFSLPQETRSLFRPEIPLGLTVPDHTVPYGTALWREASEALRASGSVSRGDP